MLYFSESGHPFCTGRYIQMEKIGTVLHNSNSLSVWKTTYEENDAPAYLLKAGEELETIISVNDGPTSTMLAKTNRFLAKTYSENEPYRDSLLNSGLFRDTGGRVPSGFVKLEIWEELKK